MSDCVKKLPIKLIKTEFVAKDKWRPVTSHRSICQMGPPTAGGINHSGQNISSV